MLSNSGPIMRELLRKSTPMEVAALSESELQLAILNAMAERAKTPTGGMANRNQPAAELYHHAAMAGNLSHLELRDLQQRLERAFRRAFDSLEQNRLIEPASGLNGHNGYVVLTSEGAETAKHPIDFDAVRVRTLLRSEMLHAKLRDKPYKHFAGGDPSSAVFEAFKIVEIEVRRAANTSAATFGQNLMLQAFDANSGALTDMSETEPTRNALARLFAGAMGRFKNPGSHTHRTFTDLYEPIEELLLASRLLRFLDEPSRQ